MAVTFDNYPADIMPLQAGGTLLQVREDSFSDYQQSLPGNSVTETIIIIIVSKIIIAFSI